MKTKLSAFLVCAMTFVSAALAQTKSPPEMPMPAVGAQNVSVDPPAHAKLLLTARGDGVQVYTCEQQDNNWQWKLKGPDAILFDEQGNAIGTHFTGPTWQLTDGSAVQGTLIASQPQVTTIPWLLLSAKSTGGSGMLERVTFVRRTDTVGGRAPKVGCDAQHPHAEGRSPYTAKYSFYTND
jgi:hypothetical protein